jgi:hypothetical protein
VEWGVNVNSSGTPSCPPVLGNSDRWKAYKKVRRAIKGGGGIITHLDTHSPPFTTCRPINLIFNLIDEPGDRLISPPGLNPPVIRSWVIYN